jgi:hypothetical protein
VEVWVAALALAASSASADPWPCASTTGYALVGLHGNASYDGDVAWLCTPPGGGDVFCDPPHAGRVELGGSRGSVIVECLAGTGVAFATGAIANPSGTAPIPVVVRARHDFARFAASVSGSGDASNSHDGSYEVRRDTTFGTTVDSWNSDGLVPTDGGRFDFARPLNLLPNVRYYLSTTLRQESYTRGTLGAVDGSGAADASSTVTFAVDTEAAASILFGVESALGIPPRSSAW